MLPVQHLQSLIPQLSGTTILVIGDVMLDQYIWGNVSRISPEAPVPIVEVVSESFRLGGATNVVNNLCSLGGKAIICSVVGNDPIGVQLKKHLQTIGVVTDNLISDPSRPTTLKTRVIAHHQQVVRFDREIQDDITPDVVARLVEMIEAAIPSVAGIIIEDYGKGVVTADLVQEIVSRATAAGKIVAVDPKTSHFSRYTGVSVITPNHHEAGASLQMKINSYEKLLLAGKRLLENVHCDFVLITRGEEGMSFFDRQRGIVTHVPAVAQEVYDVTGAGDTVVATLTLGLAVGIDPIEAVLLSNAAAGVVVGKLGAATVTPQELSQALSKMDAQPLEIQQERFR